MLRSAACAIQAVSILLAGSVQASGFTDGPGAVSALAEPCPVAFGFYQNMAPWTPAGLDDFARTETAVARRAAIIHWYQAWGFAPGNSRDFSPVMLQTAWTLGSTPMITWSPWDVTLGPTQQTFPLARIAAGDFDAYIDEWAIGLRDYAHPVLLRFAHEMQGDWYPWAAGVNGNTTQDYIAAFQHVHSRFDLQSAVNVQWLWSPNREDAAYPSLVDFYPGDAFVDWMAPDLYNFGTTAWWSSWQSLANILAPTYDLLQRINPNKPIILAEWGTVEEGGDKGQWIREAGLALPTLFPAVRAAVWFNELDGTVSLDSSAGSMAGARDAFGSATFCSSLDSVGAGPRPVARR